ncbi:MAG: flagellar motor protein PomA [Pseudomonadota bacterium]
MDLATVVGFIGAFGVMALAVMMGGAATVFINPPSILVVLGGTLLVVLSKFTMGQFMGAAQVAMKAILVKVSEPRELVDKAVELAQMSRQGGLLALESAEIPDEFMQKGIGYLVDGHDAATVKTLLMKDLSLTLDRHTKGQAVFKAMGDVAPAMGMIGTLIGLVQMLSNMEDPQSIGPAMAVALLTTLYGAVIANVVAFPIADKLALRSKEEKHSKSLTIDALMAIQDGQNPRVIEGMLENYLPVAQRNSNQS